MIAFLKKIPLWLWIALVVVIIFAWQAATGAAYSKKLFNMVADQIRTDQSKVVSTLEENMKGYEKEISDLQAEKAKLQQDKLAVQVQAAQSAAQVAQLRGKINDLQNQLDKITVSADPNALILDLQRRGLGSIHIRGSRP